GGVQDVKSASQYVHVSDLGEHSGRFDLNRVRIENPIHLGRLQNNFGLDFHGSQSSSRIGGEVRITSPTSKNHHSPFFQVANGSSSNERLCHFSHFNGRKDSRVDVYLLQGILQSDGVNNGCQHTHEIA